MKAKKESKITIELSMEEAIVIIGAIRQVYAGERQLLDFYGDETIASKVAKDFLDETQGLI